MNEALGWIKMYRSILEWDWWSDHNVTRLFLYFLVKANSVDKKWRGTVVKRGSFVTGLTQISEETGLSVQQLRTAIEKLKSTGEITDESTSQYRIVTICNYDRYQAKQDEYQQANQQPEQQTDNSQSTDEQQANNNNQEYKNKRIKEDIITPLTPQGEGQKDLFGAPEKIKPSHKDKDDKFDFYNALLGIGIEGQVAKDWLEIRKNNRAKNTETAFKQINGALKDITQWYKITFTDAIRICVTNGWYGCKLSYFANVKLSDFHLTPSDDKQSKPQPILGIGEFLRSDGTRTYGSGIITIPNDAPPRRYSNEAWVNGKWTVI